MTFESPFQAKTFFDSVTVKNPSYLVASCKDLYRLHACRLDDLFQTDTICDFQDSAEDSPNHPGLISWLALTEARCGAGKLLTSALSAKLWSCGCVTPGCFKAEVWQYNLMGVTEIQVFRLVLGPAAGIRITWLFQGSAEWLISQRGLEVLIKWLH